MAPSPSFEGRSSHRLAVACPVIFAGAPFVGEGILKNLSLTGCSVACDRTVLAGSYVRLALLLPASHMSLRVELGKIRWVRDRAFGVAFIRAPAFQQRPLDHEGWNALERQLAKHPRRSLSYRQTLYNEVTLKITDRWGE